MFNAGDFQLHTITNPHNQYHLSKFIQLSIMAQVKIGPWDVSSFDSLFLKEAIEILLQNTN